MASTKTSLEVINKHLTRERVFYKRINNSKTNYNNNLNISIWELITKKKNKNKKKIKNQIENILKYPAKICTH